MLGFANVLILVCRQSISVRVKTVVNVVDVTYDENEIIAAVDAILKKQERPKSDVYGGGDAGDKIAQLLKELPLQFHKTITY